MPRGRPRWSLTLGLALLGLAVLASASGDAAAATWAALLALTVLPAAWGQAGLVLTAAVVAWVAAEA